ncbi:MAG: ABC transporter permease [Cytophagales bacterium]
MEIENDEPWNLVIKPKTGLLEINFKELWQYKDLVFLFVRRDFVALYKQTILGPLWFLIQPLLTAITFTVIFSKVAKIPTSGIPPMVFYMSGLVMWNYFSTCLSKTSNTFITNASIFGKVYFPRLVVPISDTLTNFISFGIQFALFVALILVHYFMGYAIQPNWYILLFPVLLVILAGLGLGFGIIFSSLTTKYRDLTFLISFGVQLAMYATPVIYPMANIPEDYRAVLWFNPMAPVIETFRYGLFSSGSFDWLHLGYAFVFMLVTLFTGIILFNKVEKNFMDVI